MSSADAARKIRLRKIFDSIVRGQAKLTVQNFRLFLEAICIDEDRPSCLSNLVSARAVPPPLQAAFRIDLKPEFFNGPITAVLQYLQAPELKAIGGGSVLHSLLVQLVHPPFFWIPFCDASSNNQLSTDAEACYAWLLLSLVEDASTAPDYRARAEDNVDRLLKSPDTNIRAMAYKLKNVLESFQTSSAPPLAFSAGGRHDNDFANYRQIAILPTADEISSKDAPYLQPSTAFEREEHRVPVYLDSQFRLTREDMLSELREEIQLVVTPKPKSKDRAIVIEKLALEGVFYGSNPERRQKWALTFKCSSDLWFFERFKPKNRQEWLKKEKKWIKHQSLSCLLVDGTPVAFPVVIRDEELIAQEPPVIPLQFDGERSTIAMLQHLRTAKKIDLLLINTAVFAYEPILKGLQQMTTIPFREELLDWDTTQTPIPPDIVPHGVVEALKLDRTTDIGPLLGLNKKIILDGAQSDSLLASLSQRMSFIQGPPGTGKSFIGAILAKIIYQSTKQSILVCCYTNHALDQFLEELLDVGIPSSAMVRLGGKSTPRTQPLLMFHQNKPSLSGQEWRDLSELQKAANSATGDIDRNFTEYKKPYITASEIMSYVEFEDPDFFMAFQVPQSSDGSQIAGRDGRQLGQFFLYDRWCGGQDAGFLAKHPYTLTVPSVWAMSRRQRDKKRESWIQGINTEKAEALYSAGQSFNEIHRLITEKHRRKDAALLASKRIIGCTTTAAAMQSWGDSIRDAAPAVLLVEEAGEILESHVLTAMSEGTKQVILIGDHEQLRPKVNSYQLTVEKGEGYDLNVSLFERLILKGYPHHTLSTQHRMRPEISRFIRSLTYPHLLDSPKTRGRPDLRGVRDNVVFISHDHAEDENRSLKTLPGEMSFKASKQNTHEAIIILKILHYLGQQGYATKNIVILTPYLGQLHKLQEALKGDITPILSDLDVQDLIHAGVSVPMADPDSKRSVRLSTIDNYQGEESDIVLASLTRSNTDHDIGFMFASQRLNVLISRARNALIMIGNVNTFRNARKGRELWNSFFTLLEEGKHIFDGFPVVCERHPDRTANLRSAQDFDDYAPNGGCDQSCGAKLSCGLHQCLSRCHIVTNHSNVKCHHPMEDKCSRGHTRNWTCIDGPPSLCSGCAEQSRKDAAEKRKKLLQRRKEAAAQKRHDERLAKIDVQIVAETAKAEEEDVEKEREEEVRRRVLDLERLRQRTRQRSSAFASAPVPPPSSSGGAGSLTNAGNASSPPSRSVSPGQPRSSPPPPPPMPNVSNTQPHSNPPSLQQSRSSSPSPQPTSTYTPKPMHPSVSRTEQEWAHRKRVEGKKNEHVDKVMTLVGLETVKEQILTVMDKIEVAKQQRTSLKDQRFNVAFLGNPGTGKTTVAREYAKFLTSMGVLPGEVFIETTGSRLASEGVGSIKDQIGKMVTAGGGAIFIDEAYQLTVSYSTGGREVLDFLLGEMENNVGKVLFILAGYNKEMEQFFEHNPGLKSRVPQTFQFADYKDEELMDMMERRLIEKYKGQMAVEGGMRGLYSRIAIRRVGRGRGHPGFGNARALANMIDRVTDRQAKRVQAERRAGQTTDVFFLSKNDLIIDPTKMMKQSEALKELHTLTGLKEVKDAVDNFVQFIAANYRRELLEKEPILVPLNRVFLGSPGTGKTTVAKLYGQILADLGMLSNGEVVVKNPSDFIGQYIGSSEQNTKKILASTVGKVLVIDEAYMLGGSNPTGSHGGTDSFKSSVIDTLVAEVQNVPGDDRCVLLLGYDEPMKKMFQSVNPGLARRFRLEEAFDFKDFTLPELMQILDQKMRKAEVDATTRGKVVARDVLNRMRDRPNFGNGGDVENLLGKAKENYQKRYKPVPVAKRPMDMVFDREDFDPDYDRASKADANLVKMFQGMIGCDHIVEKLGDYQKVAQMRKAQGKDPRDLIPMNFVFKGPPGTGKTTVARKMGQVYYDMGLLSSLDVEECSASDLVGQYVGHTGPKTQKLFENALGKVLFIDEAYRLASGQFAQEAMDEIVTAMTQEKFKGKLIVILAGYERDINQLMSVNSGLSSRFPEEIIFYNLTPENCLDVMRSLLKKEDMVWPRLEDPSTPDYEELSDVVKQMSGMPSWGNARDIGTMTKELVRLAYKQGSSGTPITIQDALAMDAMQEFWKDRRYRAANLPRPDQRKKSAPPVATSSASSPPPPPPKTNTNSNSAGPKPPSPKPPAPKSPPKSPPPKSPPPSRPQSTKATPQSPTLTRTPLSSRAPTPNSSSSSKAAVPRSANGATRDAGVSDDVWKAVCDAEKKKQEDRKKNLAEQKRLKLNVEKAKRAMEARQAELRALQAKAVANAEHRKKIAEMQRKAKEAREKADRERKILEEYQRRVTEERNKREKAFKALQRMGVCVQGYQWTRVAGGWRCGGGSHFVTDSQLNV